MGIDKSTFQFLKELKKNNDRDWFQANKKRYQAADKDVKRFIDELIIAMSEFDPGLAGVEAKNCTFRIYRDVRFSKNKLPYKTGMGAYITPGGRKAMLAGYYVHIEPGACVLAGGAYMPPSDWLKAIRAEIDYNAQELKSIIHSPSFSSTFSAIEGEKLKTSPRDYSADHPEIELLRMKSWTAMHKVTDAKMCSKNIIEHAVEVFSVLKPFNDFLNMALDGDEEEVKLI